MPRETWTLVMKPYSGNPDQLPERHFRISADSPKKARDVARKKLGKNAPDYYVADQTKG